MISVRSVCKSFETRSGEVIDALSDINLDIAPNEFIAVVGPSGCGKSTLLRLVSGLTSLTSGEVRINGAVVDEPYSDIGFVFQQPVLLPWRTVRGNVMLSIEMLGLKEKSRYFEKADELLEFSGLSRFAQKYPRELSGGMQQRVSICRALVHDPGLLMMDEPFGALDAMTRDEMSIELLRIWDEHKKTILFVTHSIPEAILLADRVVVISARPGRIVEVVDVDLPRPRDLAAESSEQFNRLNQHIRSLIFSETKEVGL